MIVGFTGKAGAGKSTAAKTMIDVAIDSTAFGKAALMSFADPIKRIAKESFGWDGQKDEKGRRLLQVIGTEAGREYSSDIWIDALLKRADGLGDECLVCVDDVRFDNEAEAIRECGGHVFAVEGRLTNLGLNAAHSSERGVDEDLITDTVFNGGSPEDLKNQVRLVFDCWLSPDCTDECCASCKGECDPDDRMGFIQTMSGTRFDFADPTVESIRLEDIAHALARICRFGGHTNRFYSVADHSLNVARHLAWSNANYATVLAGLLHDAAEAYIGDIVTPFKRMIPQVSVIESRIARTIRARFGLNEDQVDFDAIKRGDETMLVVEAKSLFDFEPLENWTNVFRAEPLLIPGHISRSQREAELFFSAAVMAMLNANGKRRAVAWN